MISPPSTAIVNKNSNLLLSAISSITATPRALAASTAQMFCIQTLEKIQEGRLTLKVKAQTFEFGQRGSALHASVTVVNDYFWGLGEAYMYGDVKVDDLTAFLMDGKRILPVGLNSLVNNLFTSRISNSIYNSLSNIQAHYDLGNDMFEAFLDETMTYSCPIWESESDTLAEASMRKIHAILDRACIHKDHHILEIGTGWGALAIEAVRRHGCKVTSLTLSQEQQLLAQQRIAKAGLSDSITVLLQDYRTMDPREYQFDRIVSVEMLEAVPNGIISLQVITMPESRYDAYCVKTDFIQKHIFPGGHCPSLTALTNAIHSGTNARMMIDEVVNIGPHYARALRLWREKFLETFDAVALKSSMREIYTPEFKHFAFCEVGFATRTLGDLQLRICRVNNEDLLEGSISKSAENNNSCEKRTLGTNRLLSRISGDSPSNTRPPSSNSDSSASS